MRTYHVARGFIAIGLMFTIGCADGQREGNHGKGKKLVRNRGLVGLNTPSKTSDGKPLVTGLDANAQKSIEATIAGLKNGVEIKTFAAGTYPARLDHHHVQPAHAESLRARASDHRVLSGATVARHARNNGRGGST